MRVEQTIAVLMSRNLIELRPGRVLPLMRFALSIKHAKRVLAVDFIDR